MCLQNQNNDVKLPLQLRVSNTDRRVERNLMQYLHELNFEIDVLNTWYLLASVLSKDIKCY